MQQPIPSQVGPLQRPLGVTILVSLALFRGAVGLWASVAVVGVLSSVAAGDATLLNLIWLAIATLFVLLAYGAWSLNPWAWTLGVGLTAGSIALELFGLLTEGQSLAGTLISMSISAAILLLLLRPDVTAAFRRS